MARLSEIFYLQMGKTPARANVDYWEDGTNSWVSIADLSNYEKYVGQTKEKITDLAVRKSGIKAVPPNTVIMSFKLSLGKTAITQEPIYTNEAIMAFIPKDTCKILPDYLFYVLSSRDWSHGTNRAVMGVTLNKAVIGEINIEIPPYDEQCQVAMVLDKVSVLISLHKQQLAKLDELVKARFVEMFGDPVQNGKEWEIKRLVDVCTKLTDGTHFSPESFPTGDYKYITAKNIKEDGFDFSNITYVSEDVHAEIYSRCNPEYGDILYIKDGVTTGIAMVNTLHEPFTMLSSVALLKQDRSIVLGEYLCGVLNNSSMYKSIRENMGGAAITRLTIKKLNDIMVPIPPMEFQKKYVDVVSRMNKSRLTIQQSLTHLETLKKTLMQEYFG